MSKGLKAAYTVFAVIAVIAAVGTVLSFSMSSSQTVEIISGGEVLYTIDLSHTADRVIRVGNGSGCNTIEITGGKIHVTEADCPDKTCVRMGFLQGSAPIVCLPNRLVIRYVQGSNVDAVAG